MEVSSKFDSIMGVMSTISSVLFFVRHLPVSLFPCYFSRQFFTTNFPQRWQIVSHQFPNDGCRDVSIVVAEDISDARHLLPRNLRVTVFHVVGEVATCLRDNFDAALHNPLSLPIGLKGIKRHSLNATANTLDSLDNISKTWNKRRSGHQNTQIAAASMRCRNVLCRLSRVMISALHLRI
ncbi:hypothetical protein MBAV_000332 [Candidatus Magnetobacterium bavaricum]|uniref:Uncharacterized protein n=1 Tax=Candidatus Magnetobacterium bavaricum TaxID=29290 RepID=A0A0F3GZY8_9BACT|nr:hypothetical protein MBAV_000332 [Candidatus Magnetobacterium bavaricum]